MDTDSPDLQQYQEAVQNLGYAYTLEREGNTKAALYACDDAIRLAAPFLAEAFNLRGVLLEEIGRSEDALAVYRMALALKPGFAEAADNLMALETELDVEPDLVTIARFSQAAEAHVHRGKLESEGIPAIVADQAATATGWPISEALGGVRLLVCRADAEEALDILGIAPEATEEDDEGEEDVEEEEDEDEPTCPECGSTRIHYEKHARRAVFASWLLLGIPFPFRKRKWRCLDCEHEWRVPVEADASQAEATL